MLLKPKIIIEQFEFCRILSKGSSLCKGCKYNSVSHDKYDCRDIQLITYKRLINVCTDDYGVIQKIRRNYKRKYEYIIVKDRKNHWISRRWLFSFLFNPYRWYKPKISNLETLKLILKLGYNVSKEK